MVSTFGYLRGGLEGVMFDEMRWLRHSGHDVDYLRQPTNETPLAMTKSM